MYIAGCIAVVLSVACAELASAAGRDLRPIMVRTLAGSGIPGMRDGVGAVAEFEAPTGVAVAADGTIYVADADANAIRTIARDGTVRTLANNGKGYRDGPVSQAQFSHPLGLAVGKDGSLYIADLSNRAVRRLKNGVVSTIAGSPSLYGSADGPIATAQLILPKAVAVDDHGDVFVADSGNGVRKITPDGTVTTIAGLPKIVSGVACAGRSLFVATVNGISLVDIVSGNVARSLPFDQPLMGKIPLGKSYAIAALNESQVAFTDVHTNTVRYVESFEFERVVAGAAEWDPEMSSGGFEDGDGTRARFDAPAAIAWRPDGSLVVADAGNRRVRSISAWDRTYYVQRNGYYLDDFSPGPNEDGIAWLGNSNAWSDTTWYESIEGIVQRGLAASPLYQGKKRRPRIIPMAFPGSRLEPLMSAIDTYFANGLVKAVVIQLNGAFTDEPATVATTLRAIDAKLKPHHVKLIVVLHPAGYVNFSTENFALFADTGGYYAYEATQGPYAALAAAVKSTGIDFYDAMPDFQRASRAGEGPLFGTADPHPTVLGRSVLGKAAITALTKFLAEK